MEKNDRRAIGGSVFCVSNIEQAGIDLLHEANEVCVPG